MLWRISCVGTYRTMVWLVLSYNYKGRIQGRFEFVELTTIIFHTLKSIFLVQLNLEFQHLSKTNSQPLSSVSILLYIFSVTVETAPWLLRPISQMCFWSHPFTFLRSSLQQWLFLYQAFLFLLCHFHQKKRQKNLKPLVSLMLKERNIFLTLYHLSSKAPFLSSISQRAKLFGKDTISQILHLPLRRLISFHSLNFTFSWIPRCYILLFISYITGHSVLVSFECLFLSSLHEPNIRVSPILPLILYPPTLFPEQIQSVLCLYICPKCWPLPSALDSHMRLPNHQHHYLHV